MARRPWLTLLALLVAPSAATVIVSYVAGFFYSMTGPRGIAGLLEIGADALLMAPFGMYFAGLVAIPASLSMGWIVHAGLRAQGITDLRSYVFCALFAGLLLVLPGLLFFPLHFVFWGLPIAALSGCFLWTIRRPDRDMANPTTRAA